MNNKITYRQVLSRLEENNLFHGPLTLHNGVTIIISQRGGRIFGPFLSPDSESIFWMNGVFAHSDSFREFLNSGDWNLGGERIWIGPEIQYNIQNRNDFWGTYNLPKQIDPGTYTLDQPRSGQWRLRQKMILDAYNLASGRKELHLERLVNKVEDPLRNLSDYQGLMDGVIFAGWEQTIFLSESKRDHIMSQAWNLVQLNPGGILLIPSSPKVEVTNYFEPIDEELQTIHDNYVALKITGNRQYKVGYKAAHVFGRLAYLNHLDDGRAYLIVRNFYNDPSGLYLEEPPDRPGWRGDSIYVYNDDGGFGGFGELECLGQAIGGITGRSSSTDRMALWLYVGDADKVKRIALHLLGIAL